MIKIYNLFAYMLLVVSFIILFVNYELVLSILPMSYIIVKLILNFCNNKNLRFTKYIYDIYGVIRLIIIPMLIAVTNDKIIDNLPLGHDYFNYGVVLISIEFIIGAMALFIYSKLFSGSSIKSKKKKDYYLSGSKPFYMIFILVIIISFFFISEVRESVSFLVIKTHENGRGTETVSSFVVLIRMLLQLALALLFILASYSSYKKYKCNPNFKYLILPLILGLINISLIVGERRSIQLYTLISVLVIISLLFKNHKTKINTVIIVVGAFILILMTLYKELYIFNFSSYSQALEASSASNIKFVDQLQSYFYGPSNVAAAIDYLNYYTGSFNQFLFDNIRSIFGLNIFVDKNRLITSQLFNQIIYGNKQLTGHLISSAGYGYIYFGSILFFLVILFNLFLSCIFEFLLHRTYSLEILFVGTFVYMRIVASIFGNSIPILTMISSIIIIYSVVIIFSIMIKKLTSGGVEKID